MLNWIVSPSCRLVSACSNDVSINGSGLTLLVVLTVTTAASPVRLSRASVVTEKSSVNSFMSLNPVRQHRDFVTSQGSRPSQGQQGRARHSVGAADSSLFAEWRARSDAPYLIHIEISLSRYWPVVERASL